MCFLNRKLGNDIIINGAEIYENENEKDIYDDDGEFMDAEKTDGSYYIGLAGYVENQSEPILLSSISPSAFLTNGHSDILDYLTEYSISRVANPELNILKLCVDDRQTYNVVIKTHWLRLVQRKWKNIYNAGRGIRQPIV
jgi:hypothetical protein